MTLSPNRKQAFNPPELQVGADMFHMSQALRVGDMIWVSGQVGCDANMAIPEGLEAQSRLAFQNLQSAVEAAGATMADLVELTLLFTDPTMDLSPFMQVKDAFVPAPYPAITGFGVTGLAMPGLLVEIRAVAVAGCGAN